MYNFSERANKILVQAYELRIRLINAGVNNTNLTLERCEKALEEIDLLETDVDFAQYINDDANYQRTLVALPGMADQGRVVLCKLREEAGSLLKNNNKN